MRASLYRDFEPMTFVGRQFSGMGVAACLRSSRFWNGARSKPPNSEADRPYSPKQSYLRRIGSVGNCDFCPITDRHGRLHGCATNCPKGTLYYSDENEDVVSNSRKVTLQLSRPLRDRAAYRYSEEIGTKPRAYYLPLRSTGQGPSCYVPRYVDGGLRTVAYDRLHEIPSRNYDQGGRKRAAFNCA